MEDAKELFPAMFPCSYTSVLDILRTGQHPLPQLDFSKPAATAKIIFGYVLQRVRERASVSPLLRVEQALRPSLSEIPKNPGETRKDFRQRKKMLHERNENSPTPPECLLTLASTTENFYTALVRKMHEVVNGAMPKKADEGKIEGAMEALLYRLALKEPRAFSEVFD
ncbi:hypothetical protein LTR85_007785 [Meristemomyces frigidus]|nr:hypothetical protein LTR85_007785 [Meristemomyces frigidus]